MSDSTCSIDGCDKPVRIKVHGWCWMHYTRWHRHGDPLVHLRQQPASERFWKFVAITPGCWLWTGSTLRGYGQFEHTTAHRFSYELHIGPIPDGLEIDHLCRNRSCVNPAHLEPVTHAENMRRVGPYHWARAKTHCKSGHEFTPENTYVDPSGFRNCRTCRSAAAARHRAECERRRT